MIDIPWHVLLMSSLPQALWERALASVLWLTPILSANAIPSDTAAVTEPEIMCKANFICVAIPAVLPKIPDKAYIQKPSIRPQCSTSNCNQLLYSKISQPKVYLVVILCFHFLWSLQFATSKGLLFLEACTSFYLLTSLEGE